MLSPFLFILVFILLKHTEVSNVYVIKSVNLFFCDFCFWCHVSDSIPYLKVYTHPSIFYCLFFIKFPFFLEFIFIRWHYWTEPPFLTALNGTHNPGVVCEYPLSLMLPSTPRLFQFFYILWFITSFHIWESKHLLSWLVFKFSLSIHELNLPSPFCNDFFSKSKG